MIRDSLLDDFEELNQNFKYAPFWKRAIAATLDVFMMAIFCIVESFFFGFLQGIFVFANFLTLEPGKNISNISMFVILLIPTIYFSYCECTSRQATPGKQIMGLQVVNTNIQKITFRYAFIRAILRWISTIFCLIGYIPALFTRKHQAFHDLVAQTLVVEKNNLIF